MIEGIENVVGDDETPEEAPAVVPEPEEITQPEVDEPKPEETDNSGEDGDDTTQDPDWSPDGDSE